MTLAEALAALALVAATASWVVGRRSARQLRDVTALYWQLKFEHGELKTRLDRAMPDPDAPPRTPPGTQFVPLSSVKR